MLEAIKKEINEIFHPMDYAFAHCIDATAYEEKIGEFLLYCHLSSAYRAGHLCISCIDGRIIPSFEDVLGVVSDEVTKLLIEAFWSVPEHPYLVREENSLYLTRAFISEKIVFERLMELIQSSLASSIDQKEAIKGVEQLLCEKRVLDAQANAILLALKMPVAVIYGGPGTGKTYTAALFLELFLKLQNDKGRPLKIALAAPTGKACKNIQKSIMNVLSQEILEKHITVMTLHSLLGVQPTVRKTEKKKGFLGYDLILIDESSMIDIHLMRLLLEQIANGTRLVFLGDPNQLDAIDAGAPFQDIVEAFQNFNLGGRLDVCLRAEVLSIVSMAEMVLQGNTHEFIKTASRSVKEHGCFFHRYEAGIENDLYEYFHLLYPEQGYCHLQPEEIEAHFQKRRILSPLKKGTFGTETVNRFFHELFQNRASKAMQQLVEPILLTKNDQELGVSNGQSGFIKYEYKNQEFSRLFIEDSSFAKEGIPSVLVPSFDLAFCMSVHKSQGSEFEDVWIFLPKGSELFGRKMLYTAITRAKKRVRIWAESSILEKTIDHNVRRNSGLLKKIMQGLSFVQEKISPIL